MRIAIREQVQGTARLFEARPEHGAAHEQDDQGECALLFIARQLSENQHKREKCHSHADDEFRGLIRNSQRVERDAARDGYGDEDDYGHHGDADSDPASPAPLGIDRRVARAVRMQASIAEVVFGQPELDEAEQHADARGGEAPVPPVVVALPQGSAYQRPEKGAHIDAHVEDAEAAVATRIAGRV